MKQEVLIGQTDYTVLVKIRTTAGAPATGLDETDVDIAYARVETDNDVTTTDVTPQALSALTDAHTDWGFEEVSATDHPGLYRLDLADAVFASGAWSAVVTITGTGLDPADLEFVLIAFNPRDAVRLGLTALPNAAADAAGGLPISDAGGLDLDAKIGALTYGTANRVNAQVFGMEANTVTATAIASDAITAAKIAAGAIDAATFAADVDAEILSYLVDDATRIDASALNTATATTIPDILVDTGTTLQGELDGIQADTEDIQSRLPTTLGANGNIKADLRDSLGVAVFNSDFTIASATASTVTLPTTYTNTDSLPDDDRYVWCALSVVAGTGAGQVVLLATAAASARQYNVVTSSMPVQLDNTSVCVVLGAWSGNTTHLGGTAQTARDVGASVLLSSGTGAGQVKLSSGYVAPNWGDVGNPTTTVGLSGTTVKTATDVETDTADIQGRLPAALVSGRMDASVGAMAVGVLTAAAIAADAITDAKVASDVTIASVTGAVGSVTGNVGGNVVGSVASVAAITTSGGGVSVYDFTTAAKALLQTEAADALAAYDPPTNAEMEARTLAAASYATAAALDAVDNFLDTEVAAIKGVTDKLDTALEQDGAVYRYTTNALEQGPSGGGAVADWTADERTAIRSILGVPASGTTPDDPSAGILDTIRDGVALGATQVSVDDLPTNAELATALGTADDAVLAQVSLVKAKTDLIPASPASVGSAMTLADGAITEAKITMPAEAAGAPTGFLQIVLWIAGMLGLRRVVKSATTIKQYMSDSSTEKTSSTYTSSGSTDTLNKAT